LGSLVDIPAWLSAAGKRSIPINKIRILDSNNSSPGIGLIDVAEAPQHSISTLTFVKGACGMVLALYHASY
jgi:hypothetical protein